MLFRWCSECDDEASYSEKNEHSGNDDRDDGILARGRTLSWEGYMRHDV